MGEWLFQEDRRLARLIPWEAFRKDLNRVCEVEDVRFGDRTLYNVVMMLKSLASERAGEERVRLEHHLEFPRKTEKQMTFRPAFCEV